MNVFLEREEKNITITFEGTVESLLAKLNINAETVLVVRDDKLLTSDRKVGGNDEVKILSVISGG